MGFIKYTNIGDGLRINTPEGEISFVVEEILGTMQDRVGTIRIQGSPTIPDGELVTLTQKEFVKIAPDIAIKISDSPVQSSRLEFYIENPTKYIITSYRKKSHK